MRKSRKSIFALSGDCIKWIMPGLSATVLSVVCLVGCSSSPPEPHVATVIAEQNERTADFDEMWAFVDSSYCCFTETGTNWRRVRSHYRPLAAGALDRRAFIAVLEEAIDELHDPHTHLGVNLASSYRLPPYDIWAEWRDRRAFVSEVRMRSAAAYAGVRAGDEIVEIDGLSLHESVTLRKKRLVATPSSNALDAWALLSVIAGVHNRPRSFTLVDRQGMHRKVTLDDGQPSLSVDEPSVTDRVLDGGIAYVRISSFAVTDIVERFDAALERHRGASGLIIDVRDNDGGDTAIARPILGRLIEERRQYAWMARREGATLGQRWPEFVESRGPFTYHGPVVALVNHFTQSMGEGFAMALVTMQRGSVVGTRMAGLGAAIARTRLSHAGFDVQISAEPVYDLAGHPRQTMLPTIEVDLADVNMDSTDPILLAGIRQIKAETSHRMKDASYP